MFCIFSNMTLSKKGQSQKFWHNAPWFNVNVPSYNFQVLITKGSKVIFWNFFSTWPWDSEFGSRPKIFMHCTSSKSHLLMLQVSKSNLIEFSSYGLDKFGWRRRKNNIKKKKIDKNNVSPLKGRHDNAFSLYKLYGHDLAKNPCPGGHIIYNLGWPFLVYHCYTFS